MLYSLQIGLWCSPALTSLAVHVQVSRMPIIYEVNIFITNRFVPIPEVEPSERLLVEQLGVSGFYHVIARFARLSCMMVKNVSSLCPGGGGQGQA